MHLLGLLYLLGNGGLVGRSLDGTDDAQCNGQVGAIHLGLQPLSL